MSTVSFSARFVVFSLALILCAPFVYILGEVYESWLALLVAGCVLAFSVFLARGNPVDPRVWFSVFGGLYSFSFYALYLLGEEEANNFGLGVFLGYLFLASTLLSMWVASGFKSPRLQRLRWSSNRVPALLCRVLFIFLIVSMCYVALDAFILQMSGVSDKRALKALGVGLPGKGLVLNWAFFLYALFLWLFWHYRSRRSFLMLFVGLLMVYVWASTGERDALFKWIIVTTFVVLFARSVSLRPVYVLSFLVLVFVPISKDLGVVLLSSEVEFKRSDNPAALVFKGEWSSSGANFDNLLERPSLFEGIGLERFSSDVIRGIVPGAVFSGSNTRDWYYKNYTPVVTGRTVAGAGFSYSGGWYIYAQSLGVVIGGVFFGLVCWFLYVLSGRNIVWNSVYVVFVPLAIWSLRVDLSGFLSSLTKQTLFPALLVFLALFLFRVRLSGGPRASGEGSDG